MRLILISLLFVACSTSSKEVPPVIAETENISNDYQIYNLGKNFEQFWSVAKDKDFEGQLKHWNEIVESPYQDVYDSLVDTKMSNSQWKAQKEKRLRAFFELIPQKFGLYQFQFATFDETLRDYIAKYEQKFFDVRFKAKIYALPGATFNGKVGSTSLSPDNILAFGINVVDEVNDDMDVLVSHELFHLYHWQKLGSVENGRITLPLFMEGLASYASWDMNPDKSLGKILMSEELGNVSRKDVRWLAREFLKNVESKDFDPQKPELFQRWFAYGFKVRPDLPSRIGYLLGFRVVEKMASKHSLQEMAGWTAHQAHFEVKRVLRSL